jgi:hypothetical protein
LKFVLQTFAENAHVAANWQGWSGDIGSNVRSAFGKFLVKTKISPVVLVKSRCATAASFSGLPRFAIQSHPAKCMFGGKTCQTPGLNVQHRSTRAHGAVFLFLSQIWRLPHPFGNVALDFSLSFCCMNGFSDIFVSLCFLSQLWRLMWLTTLDCEEIVTRKAFRSKFDLCCASGIAFCFRISCFHKLYCI